MLNPGRRIRFSTSDDEVFPLQEPSAATTSIICPEHGLKYSHVCECKGDCTPLCAECIADDHVGVGHKPVRISKRLESAVEVLSGYNNEWEMTLKKNAEAAHILQPPKVRYSPIEVGVFVCEVQLLCHLLRCIIFSFLIN